MKTPDPKEYSFLWKVNNMSYFKTSYWLHEEYLKRCFLITCKGTEWKTYIENRELERLSKFGLVFFQKHFRNYKKRVKSQIKRTKRVFIEISKKKISGLSDAGLSKGFLHTIKFARSLWELYFFTEYFLHDKLQSEIEKNPTKSRLLKKIREMQKIKFEFRDLLNKTIFKGNIFEKYINEIHKRMRRNDLDSLHYQEIAGLLTGKKIKTINRKNFVLGYFNNWKPITGKQAFKLIEAFDGMISQEVKQKAFTGSVANPGFHKGHVKIIPFDLKKDLSKEIAKMKRGDVLVTGSTGPEMILACKKAGAIVTEEGGICSHAAIVSRELGIPCIIGTKIATQVLKDGDLVEVDANKGIIKIL